MLYFPCGELNIEILYAQYLIVFFFIEKLHHLVFIALSKNPQANCIEDITGNSESTMTNYALFKLCMFGYE